MELDFKKWQQQAVDFFNKQPRYVLYGSGLILLGVLLIIIGVIVL